MDRWLQLILLMSEDDYVTNKQLADALGVSSRTVYNDITQLNQAMKDNGGQLISRPRYGVKLMVTDEKKYKEFLRSLEVDVATIGDNTETRVSKIVEKMIQADSPVKIDDLSDEMFVSRSTLKNDLKKVRSFIEKYDLKIDFRSYAGMEIYGSEKNLRRCLAKIEQNMIANDGSFLNQEMDDISELLRTIFRRHHYRMSSYSFQNFVTHISVSINRIKQGKSISFVYAEKHNTDVVVKNLAEDIVTTLGKSYGIAFSQSEFEYILLHLECKKMVSDHNEAIVSPDEYSVAVSMLQEVQKVFHYDFQYDFELIMHLSMHIVPLRLRLLYDMQFDNPMTSEIFEGAPLAYEMANVACSILKRMYEKKVSADEVAYIALHFNVAIERYKKKHKKNVLLICGTGKGSAMLLAYRIQEEYGKYLNVLGTHDSINLSDIDFSNVDYILTTVHIREYVPVPVIEIGKLFFMGETSSDIWKYFQDGRREALMRYFSKELFFPHLTESTKVDMLRRLCESAAKYDNIPDDILAHVMKREEIGGTAFGNYVAIPHPDHPMGKESFVVTGILDRPILWDKDEVQIVFLLVMKSGGDRHLQLFYRSVSRFLSNKALVQRLLQNQSYEELIAILDSLSYSLR